jgi:hypothetical protein
MAEHSLITNRVAFLAECARISELVKNGMMRGWVEEVIPAIVDGLMRDIATLDIAGIINLAQHYIVAKWYTNNSNLAEVLDMRWLEQSMTAERIRQIDALIYDWA